MVRLGYRGKQVNGRAESFCISLIRYAVITSLAFWSSSENLRDSSGCSRLDRHSTCSRNNTQRAQQQSATISNQHPSSQIINPQASQGTVTAKEAEEFRTDKKQKETRHTASKKPKTNQNHHKQKRRGTVIVCKIIHCEAVKSTAQPVRRDASELSGTSVRYATNGYTWLTGWKVDRSNA